MTGLDDPEDNQQTLESATELETVVPITIQEDFLQGLCDNAGKPTFSRWNFCDGTRNGWHHYNCFVYIPAINSLSSTLQNSISHMCALVNKAHCHSMYLTPLYMAIRSHRTLCDHF